MDGTSMATPVVAGVAALMFAEAPELTGYQVKTLITGSIDPVGGLSGKVGTGGRVNAYQSILSAQSGEVVPVDPAYNSTHPFLDRSVASAAAGGAGCGMISKGGKGPGGGGGINGLWLFSIFMLLPLLISVLLRRKTGAEKRKYERFMISSAVTLKADGKEWIGAVSSISMGGAQVDTSVLMRDDSIVTMNIESPDGKQSIQVKGKVVWSEAQKHYGVQFAEADKSVLSQISQWTKSLVKT
jgi:hypothetical protein